MEKPPGVLRAAADLLGMEPKADEMLMIFGSDAFSSFGRKCFMARNGPCRTCHRCFHVCASQGTYHSHGSEPLYHKLAGLFMSRLRVRRQT